MKYSNTQLEKLFQRAGQKHALPVFCFALKRKQKFHKICFLCQ